MARVARRDAPLAVRHVMLRGIERRRLFLDDADREDFLDRLDRQVFEGGGACFAWALMPNHAHGVLRTGKRPLSDVMRRLNTGYARRFNLRHRRMAGSAGAPVDPAADRCERQPRFANVRSSRACGRRGVVAARDDEIALPASPPPR